MAPVYALTALGREVAEAIADGTEPGPLLGLAMPDRGGTTGGTLRLGAGRTSGR